MWPKVSIIWLNYNSSRIMPIVLESLESVANLDYPKDRYELIVVDNGSRDSSFEKIKEFLGGKSSLRKKIIKLSKNVGFTGGNNIGFKARDRESKYVLLLNNDAILFQEGLKTLVEYAENYYDVAGLQGVIFQHWTKLMHSAGCYLNELLLVHVLGAYHEYPWILHKPLYITYPSGCCALYRVEHVKRCLGDKLFINEFFIFGDDDVLGLMMWNCGYKLISVPKPVASHVGGLTLWRKQPIFTRYLLERRRVALSIITNARYRQLTPLYSLKNIALSILGTRLSSHSQLLTRSIIDGLKLGKHLRKKGIFIDIYKAPIVRISPEDLGLFITEGIRGRSTQGYFEKWFIENLDILSVE